MFDSLEEVKSKSIVVMPDFFVDRIIKLGSREEFIKLLNEKARFGGGSIRNILTTERKGGNAVNIVYCLAKLGVSSVTLFTVADELGSAMLHNLFSKFGNTVNLKIERGKHGRTTGLEFIDEKVTKAKANIMLSDVADNEYFGSDKIDSEDKLKILKDADAVMVVNWGSNLKAEELVEFAFTKSPNSFHFIDPADINLRRDEFRDSLLRISNRIDALALNENEANSLAKSLGLNTVLPPSKYDEQDIKNAAEQIASKLGISVDLHTQTGAGWSNGQQTYFAPAITVEAQTLTGAGDSWDSANIVGYLCKLSTKDRLTFSNAYASLYVRNSRGEPPTMNETLDLIEKLTH
jgi:ribokinase